MSGRERWFVVIAVIVLVATTAVALAAADDSGSDLDRTVAGWTPDVPAVHDAEPPTEAGVATIAGDDHEYASVQDAVEAADPGDTIVLEGVFEEHVSIETPDLTVTTSDEASERALISGAGDGTVVHIVADNVSLANVWLSESGYERSAEDAAVLVNGNDSTLSDLRITETTYGIWIGEASDVAVEETTIAGRAGVAEPNRGNGIHLDRADGAQLRDNAITKVRDGIYFSWSDGVVAENNVLWDLRYGVHYMYSDDNRLEHNVAFDNDVGFALMVSQNLSITNNTAVNNDGPSGQGLLVKDVDDSTIRGNAVVANRNGLYVYNSHRNEFVENLLLENQVGIHFTAGSSGETVVGNSFVANDMSAYASTSSQLTWNDSERGNYWADARPADLDGDGTSELRHQPTGAIEHLMYEQPQAAFFADSPAFDAVRMAESSFPVIESPGVVDHRPLTEPPHDDWEEYYENYDN